MVKADIDRHKKAAREGMHFYVSSMKKDQESIDRIIEHLETLDRNDRKALMYGVFLSTFAFSNVLAQQLEISQTRLAEIAREWLEENDLTESLEFDTGQEEK